MNCIERAYAFAGRKDADTAVTLLEEGGRAGDADCWVELASWYLSGNIVPRDLARSRECFRLAGDAGHERARSIYIALLANGTGGHSFATTWDEHEKNVAKWRKIGNGDASIEALIDRGALFLLKNADGKGAWSTTQSTVRALSALLDTWAGDASKHPAETHPSAVVLAASRCRAARTSGCLTPSRRGFPRRSPQSFSPHRRLA